MYLTALKRQRAVITEAVKVRKPGKSFQADQHMV